MQAMKDLYQLQWLPSVTMTLAIWVVSGFSAAAEPILTPVAPTELPDHPVSVEPASPAVDDLDQLIQASSQAQDLQRIDPEAGSIRADSAVTPAAMADAHHSTSGVAAPRLEETQLTLGGEPSQAHPANLAAPSSSVAQNAEEESAGGDAASTQADLARQSQNPIANLISVPFQNSTNFGVGQFDRTSNVLNIQPVIPTSINENWVLINRTIIPVAYQPELAPGVGNVFGLGDIVYQGFFSPKDSGSFTWGIGPAVVLPTATDEVLGSGKWSVGPAAVGLVTRGPIVAGALVNNVWSIAGMATATV